MLINVICLGPLGQLLYLCCVKCDSLGTSCFQGFFSYPDMQPLLKHFCVYHINAPGQQDDAPPLPVG